MRFAAGLPAFVRQRLTLEEARGIVLRRMAERERNNLPLEDFFVVDLRLSRDLFRWLEMFVGVENLLDTAYEVSLATNSLMRMGSPRIINGGLRIRT